MIPNFSNSYSFERGLVGWFPAKVVFSLDEMVKVQTTFSNETKQECWVELESHKIARYGTYTKNDKMINHLYFQDLYKLIEPVVPAGNVDNRRWES